MLELGFFLFFNLLSFGFLAIGVSKRRGIFGDLLLMIAMVFFFMLGFYMLPEEDIGHTVNELTYNATGSLMTNSTQTQVFIADPESFYLVYTYYGLALLSFILFMFGKIKTKKDSWGDPG